MNTETLKETLSDTRMKLYEAVAILKLIDHGVETSVNKETYSTVARIAYRIASDMANSLDQLETDVEKGVKS